MAKNDVEMTLFERQSPIAENSVDYQPFGVKVLKLRVRRNQKMIPKSSFGPIWIHPEGYQRPDGASNDSAKWRVYATAVTDSDLWVAWGAGDENGFCVKTKDPFGVQKSPAKLDDDEDYYIYLHLIHRPSDPFTHELKDIELVIQATGKDKDGEMGVLGELEVTLTVPQACTNPLRAHWQWNQADGASTITLRGVGGAAAQLPLYFSRWWPSQKISWAAAGAQTMQFAQSIKMIYQRRFEDKDQGHIEVFVGDTAVASIRGDLALPMHDARLFNAELFQFLDDYHVVLRLWFYWVHLGFTTDELLAYLPVNQKADGGDEADRVAQKIRSGLIPWRKREEVPDIERFDIVLDPQNLAVKYVGTDTHWQEFWAIVAEGEPLKARIATLTDTFRVLKQANNVPEKKAPPVFDPLANGLCDFLNPLGSGHDCPHRGTGDLISVEDIEEGDNFRQCKRCFTHFMDVDDDTRAGGIAKHAPVMDNAFTMINDDEIMPFSTAVLKG
ncbi:MAG: hypothetical protein KDE48_25095 [Anaerolineales bacterium]|nr:hypothetical protein [Anaerolineales bacterium]